MILGKQYLLVAAASRDGVLRAGFFARAPAG